MWETSAVVNFVPFCSTDGEIIVRLDAIVSVREGEDKSTCMLYLSDGTRYEISGSLRDIVNKMTGK